MGIEVLRELVSSHWVLAAWLSMSVISCTMLLIDLHHNNNHIGSIIKMVCFLSMRYSGRRQISNGSLWRKGFRSVAHCYSGCSAGEVTGIFIAAGLLSLGNTAAALNVFGLRMHLIMA